MPGLKGNHAVHDKDWYCSPRMGTGRSWRRRDRYHRSVPPVAVVLDFRSLAPDTCVGLFANWCWGVVGGGIECDGLVDDGRYGETGNKFSRPCWSFVPRLCIPNGNNNPLCIHSPPLSAPKHHLPNNPTRTGTGGRVSRTASYAQKKPTGDTGVGAHS